VSVAGVKEQLMYEMGDPRSYLTPDCIADFTSINVYQDEHGGPDRVRVSGIKGRPPTDYYKVSISYRAGYKSSGALIYSWPDAYDKAREADAMLRRRLDALGLKFDAIRTEFVGAGALHGDLAGPPLPGTPEVLLRIAVRSEDKSAVERFGKELAPLALAGPPTVCGLHSGRPKAEEIVAYWPALMPRTLVQPSVQVNPA